jgi:SPOR domain
MTDEVRLAKADLKRGAPRAPVTMHGLWRLVVWGSTAATVLLIAVLSSRGVVGSQRAAVAVSTIGGATVVQTAQPLPQAAARAFDAQAAETKKLADVVRDLTADNEELKSRLAVVEHSVDDVTGSIARQAKTTPPWPDSGSPVPATPAAIAAVFAPALPLAMEYGVDIGSAVSIQALRARWAGIRSAHPQLFNGLAPTVSLSETPQSNRPELRLVVGPLASADAAAKLCATLGRFRLICQPTIFAGRHLALD